ncbi:hypothetical protein RND81_08G095700 [Saponaria officinalis]|uniref:WRKY domain-containing protein n=1 Tax=Saponaria officinalis TaxID=3572 RepID=A0AAW1J6A5_SAPOF
MSHEFKQTLKFSQHNQQQQQQKPSISIPLKTGGESLFLGTPGSNPGPMTMVSNIFNEHFADNGDFRSFSDLLLGTPSPSTTGLTLVPENWGGDDLAKDGGSGFKQKRPGNLVLPVQVSPVFNISPGFSPSLFLSSPTFLSPTLSPLGYPQQHHTLAQLTAQAHVALSQAQMNIQTDYHAPTSSSAPPHNIPTYQNAVLSATGATEKRTPNMAINVDKPADDGYNWRKYGQKQVKGSEYPRSYYRCTTANCPVKKKVERSFDGHITEIIYKGQHTHEPPQHGRRGNRDAATSSAVIDGQNNGHFRWSGRDSDHSAQPTCMLLHGPSDSEESAENFHVDDDDNEDEPQPKRRSGAAGQSDGAFTHRTMTEPKIVVQTRSEVDLLDDGYRWRKYGQKVVKGNPNPRSYYKCTTEGCKVRKHVERASTDAKAVITTYEGKHIHEVPAPRGSTINGAPNFEQPQHLKLLNHNHNHNNNNTNNNSSLNHLHFHNTNHSSLSLRPKQEHSLL